MMKSVVFPFLLPAIGQHDQFSGEQPSSQAGFAVRAGNLPDGVFLWRVPARFDDIADVHKIVETFALKLKDAGTFDSPPAYLSIRESLFHIDEAVRIDLVELDDHPLHADSLRRVVIGERMMREC